jgi:acetyl esterase/lipase
MKTLINALKKIMLLLFLSLKTLNSFSQANTIFVWTKSIPGSINASDYIEKEVIKDDQLQSTSQVKVPTLALYLPKKEIANQSAVLIFPGGGYSHLAMYKEGKKVALWLNSLGITAFVLKYRLPTDRIMKDKTIGPLQDAQEAIRLIRRNTKEWNIDPTKIYRLDTNIFLSLR